jgi:cell wall-associated NlpC family hydrolase
MTTRSDIVDAARSHLGTAYHHQGRTVGVGLDCAGLLIVTGLALGLLPAGYDVRGYAQRADGASLREYCDAALDRIDWTDARAGDVVLVSWDQGVPHHLGILTDYRWGGFAMIHAEGYRRRKVIETRLVFGRDMQFVAAYAFRGIEN